jgi:hypothetical protein
MSIALNTVGTACTRPVKIAKVGWIIGVTDRISVTTSFLINVVPILAQLTLRKMVLLQVSLDLSKNRILVERDGATDSCTQESGTDDSSKGNLHVDLFFSHTHKGSSVFRGKRKVSTGSSFAICFRVKKGLRTRISCVRL